MSDGPRHSEIFVPGLLEGRAALVTGGGTGLGLATAVELARCGAAVTICGRRAEVLEQAVSKISELASERIDGTAPADWLVGDVRDRRDADRLVEMVVERRGRLDILVNNAGGQYFTPAESIVAKGWRAVWSLNVEGILNMAEAAVEAGLGTWTDPGGARAAGADGESGSGRSGPEHSGPGDSGPGRSGPEHNRPEHSGPGDSGPGEMGGTVVNVTLSPHHGMPGMAHSGAARAAVEALTRELAGRWAGRGIAVTAVAAGHFDTEAMSKYPDTVRAGMARSVPLQRLGRPFEHAWLVALLCSPAGRALSGSTVTLDGARDNWFGPWPPPGLVGESGEVPVEERRRAPGAPTRKIAP